MSRRLFLFIEALFALAAVLIVILVSIVFLRVLFPTVKASDWPAWVQAVGSVGAILVSVGVAMYQNWTSKKESQQLRNDRTANSTQSAILAIDEFRDDINNTSEALKGHVQKHLVAHLLSRCETTQSHLEQVHLSDLRMTDAYDFAMARRSASSVVSILNAVQAAPEASKGVAYKAGTYDVFFDSEKKKDRRDSC